MISLAPRKRNGTANGVGRRPGYTDELLPPSDDAFVATSESELHDAVEITWEDDDGEQVELDDWMMPEWE